MFPLPRLLRHNGLDRQAVSQSKPFSQGLCRSTHKRSWYRTLVPRSGAAVWSLTMWVMGVWNGFKSSEFGALSQRSLGVLEAELNGQLWWRFENSDAETRADSGDLARGVLEREGDYWELSSWPFVWKSDRTWYQSMPSGPCPGNSRQASVQINGLVCLVEEIWGSVAFGLCHVYWPLLSSRSPVRESPNGA